MKSNYKISADIIDSISQRYREKVPGISIMAIKSGNIVFSKQFGLANLEYDIPITLSTVFNLASISKQFTAMAIMMLVEEGILGYEKMLTDYLSELSYCQGVTVRHLLNNTSGIENYYRIIERIDKSVVNVTNKDVYSLLIDQKSLLFEPGSKFDYSNSNWVLLSLLIENLSGLSYSQFIEENIFNRIGMKDAMVFDEMQPIVKNRAYGYRKENNNYYCDYVEALTVGDGGIFATIEDLYIWDQVLYTDKLVSRESIALAFTNGTGEGEEKYGFGWSIEDYETGNKKVWHTGLDAGFRSVITRYLDKEFTVIILSNSSQCTWDERKKITNELYEIFNKK
jgi:CubicO group peptidase (beta-lactamase class C family)